MAPSIQWLLRRRNGPEKNQELRHAEVAWVLHKENNETTILKFVPDPATGGGALALGNTTDSSSMFNEYRLHDFFQFLRPCIEELKYPVSRKATLGAPR